MIVCFRFRYIVKYHPSVPFHSAIEVQSVCIGHKFQFTIQRNVIFQKLFNSKVKRFILFYILEMKSYPLVWFFSNFSFLALNFNGEMTCISIDTSKSNRFDASAPQLDVWDSSAKCIWSHSSILKISKFYRRNSKTDSLRYGFEQINYLTSLHITFPLPNVKFHCLAGLRWLSILQLGAIAVDINIISLLRRTNLLNDFAIATNHKTNKKRYACCEFWLCSKQFNIHPSEMSFRFDVVILTSWRQYSLIIDLSSHIQTPYPTFVGISSEILPHQNKSC